MTWMVKKYPDAEKYVWQTKRMPVDKHFHNQVYFPKLLDDVRTFGIRCVNKVGRLLKLPIQLSLKTDMNPFDLWYRTNGKVSSFIDNYYKGNIACVLDSELRKDLATTFEKGGARDRMQVVNLLAIFKRYF